MGKRAICAALFSAAALTMIPAKSFGLAALDSGAKTSCKPTAPAGSPLYRTQVNCDPADVQSFQFHFQFDSSLIELVPDNPDTPEDERYTTFLGYTVDSVVDDTSTAVGATGSTIHSLIIKGHAADSTFDTSGDLSHIDVIGLNFELVNPNNLYQPINFDVFGEAGNDPRHHPDESNDFIHTFDGQGDANGDVSLVGEHSYAVESFAEIHGLAVPLPTSAWSGMALIAGLGAYKLFRKQPAPSV